MNYYRKYIILIAIISAILGIIIAFVYFLNSFQLLEVKPILLSQEYRGYTENNHSGKTEYDYIETINFYYIGGGATNNDCSKFGSKIIQLKKKLFLYILKSTKF